MKKLRKKYGASTLLLSSLLIAGLLLSAIPLVAFAAIRDKSSNTAFIVSKTAQWTDYDNFLAELTIKVNGTQVYEPLDVIILLDRSGSMDMDYIQQNSGNGPNVSTPVASCPCLNQKHFYLNEIANDVVEPVPGADEDLVYDNGNGTITVYNADEDIWVTLQAGEANHEHYYYEFSADQAHSDAKYHFTMSGDNYVRISKWVTDDVRKQLKAGLWDHADSGQGCYDRWSEAKDAVEEFTAELLSYTDDSNNPINRVALVPFSFRDTTMVNTLNASQYNELRQWLIAQNGTREFFDPSMINGTTLTGTYDAKVDWTDDLDDISQALPRLFTTADTDYMYAMSMAYNMLAGRSPADKAERRAVVVLLSDGKPYPNGGTEKINGDIAAFYNNDTHVLPLAKAIKAGTDELVDGGGGDLWTQTSASYKRHDVESQYVVDVDGVKGVYGLGAKMVTVGYMLSETASIERLQKMASDASCYIDIPSDDLGASKGYLARKLLASNIFPGGRYSVLRDVISKYYYIPDSYVPPAGVTIVGTIATGQTLVWNIGDIYKLDVPLSLTVPLVLREEWRSVEKVTYYPTNDDTPEPSLYTPEDGPDGEETGAKLYYTDPLDNDRYDTIGTPKLKVNPKPTEPTDPTEPTTGPTDPTEPTTGPTDPTEPTTGPTTGPTEPVTRPATDPTEPIPVPTIPGNRLVPDDNGGWVERDELDVPIGTWIWDDETDEWLFEQTPPLADLPYSGEPDFMGTFIMVTMCITAIGMGVVLLWKSDRKCAYGDQGKE